MASLIEALDALDGDPDLEPYLAGMPHSNDLEEEDGDDEDQGDDEPTLGAPERHPEIDPISWGMSRYIDITHNARQTAWAAGGDVDEREDVCEDEGACIQSQPHDEEPDLERGGDEEPSLGSLEIIHQWAAWNWGSSHDDRELEDDYADLLDEGEEGESSPFRLDQTDLGSSATRVSA